MIDKPVPTGTSTTATSTTNRPRGSGFALFIAALALLFTLVGVGAGYRHWQRMNIKLEKTQAAMQIMQAQLLQLPTQAGLLALQQQLQETLHVKEQIDADRLAQLQVLEQQTRQFAATVQQQITQITQLQGQLQPHNPSHTGGTAWQLAEIEFLLTLAQRELYLAHNKVTALAALRTADQRLVTWGVVDYLPIRQKLALDINALNAYPVIDIEAVAHEIQAIRKALKPPSAVTPELATATQALKSESKDQPSDQLNWWESAYKGLDALMDNAFVVRQIDQPLNQILSQSHADQVYQLLMLRLDILQRLVLERSAPAINQQIHLIVNTLIQYYPNSQVQPLIERLVGLKDMTFQPDPPDISASLTALQQRSVGVQK